MRYWVKTHNHLYQSKKIFSDKDLMNCYIQSVIEESQERYKEFRLEELGRELNLTEKEREAKEMTIKAWKGFTLTELAGNDNNLGSIIIISMNETEFNHDSWLLEG